MLSDIFWKKIKLQMRLIHVVDRRPLKKIKLEPLTEEQFDISLPAVRQWSPDNLLLYRIILENGMAEFICNREYLQEFYQSLLLPSQNIHIIDSRTLLFTNLKTLNLAQNSISCLEHLPPHCLQLFIDFNCLSSFQLKNKHPLQLLSASHNDFADQDISCLPHTFPELRCLNISYNRLCHLKETVNTLGLLPHLGILVTFNNPLSMLPIYYSYITDHLSLAHFDGVKYVKEEPKPEPPKEPPHQKKEQEKKQPQKKDSKKGGKPEEKSPPPEAPKVEVVPAPVKRELTQEDFERVKLDIQITNLQNFKGNIFDSSLFPAEIDPKKTQTSFWLKCQLMGEETDLKEKAVLFENATTDGSQLRVNFDVRIFKDFSVNLQNYRLFNQGLKVHVWQTEPRMLKDSQTFELKPVIEDGTVAMADSLVGGCYIDFRPIHLKRQKQLQYKFRLFPAEAIQSPLFLDSFEDEPLRIAQQKTAFEGKLKAMEEQAMKRAMEQQAAQQQKKGKDQKKPAEKKGGKKEGKDNPVGDKAQCPPCSFPEFDRLYALIDSGKMFKGRQLVCLSLRVT